MKKSFIHQQEEISFVKNTFTQYLIDKLDVVEVQGPILSKVGDGMHGPRAIRTRKSIPFALSSVVSRIAW